VAKLARLTWYVLPLLPVGMAFGAVHWAVPVLLAPRLSHPRFIWFYGGLVVSLAVFAVVLIAVLSLLWAFAYRRVLHTEEQLLIIRGKYSGHRWLGEWAVRMVHRVRRTD
jgi:hypothetical protein